MASGSCVLRKKSFLILKLLIEGNDTEEWGIASVSETAQEEVRQGKEKGPEWLVALAGWKVMWDMPDGKRSRRMICGKNGFMWSRKVLNLIYALKTSLWYEWGMGGWPGRRQDIWAQGSGAGGLGECEAVQVERSGWTSVLGTEGEESTMKECQVDGDPILR